MKRYSIVAAVFCGLLLASCDLERLPYNEIAAEQLDPSNIENITRGNYAKLKEEAFYKIFHQVGEYGGDNVSLSGTTSDQLFNIYTYHRSATNSYSKQFWNYSYQIIASINSMIELIPEGESTAKDQLLGENYFLRGFLYFQLVCIYARPYAKQQPETDLGVPLKLTSDINDFPPRATVKAVYEQVIKDFEKAAALMTENKINIYASKEAAQAYLSRVYLYMESWAKAKEYADFVINSGRYTLLEGQAFKDYTHVVPEDNTETIFAIRMTKDVDYEKYNMAWYSAGALYAEIDGEGWGEMYPSYSYLQLIDQHPEDIRHGFFADQAPETPATWMLYVDDVPMYVTHEVKLEGDKYIIQDGAESYTSPEVQKDGTRYYVVDAKSGAEHDVQIEPAANVRNGYPKRFIYKISLQEGQAHLYSPVMVRLGEIYLNRAEASYHLGNLDEAIADMNVIRKRAQIPERRRMDAGSDEEILTWVLDERRLEMAWEGQRKYDIFRNGLTLDRNYPGSHISSKPTYLSIAPADVKIVELLPQAEIDAYPNGLLEQNPME